MKPRILPDAHVTDLDPHAISFSTALSGRQLALHRPQRAHVPSLTTTHTSFAASARGSHLSQLRRQPHIYFPRARAGQKARDVRYQLAVGS